LKFLGERGGKTVSMKMRNKGIGEAEKPIKKQKDRDSWFILYSCGINFKHLLEDQNG